MEAVVAARVLEDLDSPVRSAAHWLRRARPRQPGETACVSARFRPRLPIRAQGRGFKGRERAAQRRAGVLTARPSGERLCVRSDCPAPSARGCGAGTPPTG